MAESTRMRRLSLLVCTVALCLAVPLLAAADAGRVIGLGFTGREVANLEQSVAFYEALGFQRDPAANPDWRRDDVIAQLYGIPDIESRMAKMYINSSSSGKRFVVYLREVRGVPRKNLSMHAAWEPGATHFGLIVPDAHALWARLRQAALLRARSWGEELVAPPGVTPGQLAYVTDPDGLDIEIINQSEAVPASDGNPAQPARVPGVSHVGLIVSDADKARAFYGKLFGGVWQASEAPWMQGDFFDSAVGGHGNILRFFNLAFPEAYAPESHINLELVEFKNRKKPLLDRNIIDMPQALAAGATTVTDTGIVTMRGAGVREIMLRDPDTHAFILLYEMPK